MIVESIDNLPRRLSVLRPFAQALEYLTGQDLTRLPLGRHSVMDDRILALVSEYQTVDLAQGKWEAHRRYIDIQTLAIGQERIGVAPLDKMKVQVPYDLTKDILWLTGSGDFVTIWPGRLAILWPEDVHMPNLAAGEPMPVKKIVMKIDLSLLG